MSGEKKVILTGCYPLNSVGGGVYLVPSWTPREQSKGRRLQAGIAGSLIFRSVRAFQPQGSGCRLPSWFGGHGRSTFGGM